MQKKSINNRLIIFLALFMLLFDFCSKSTLVSAQGLPEGDVSQCSTGTYVDLVGLGKPSALVLQCRFATDQDQIIIFPKGRTLQSDTPWQENIEDKNAIWLFDSGSNEIINLIIDFKIDQTGVLSAAIFDDQNQDGEVSHRVHDNQIVVTESEFPTVRLISQADNWTNNGQINYNLDIEVDGPVMAQASYGRFLDRLPTDGVIDFRITVRDTDQDGVPDYDFRRDTSPLPEHWGLHRVNLMVNHGARLKPIENYLLWPFLGTSYGEPRLTSAGNLWLVPYEDALGRRYGLVQDYSFLAPPVQVRWERSKILFLAEIVPSRATDKGWFIYSISNYESDQIYLANFENPFAFYDLHNNNDGVPELLVRAESAYANDPHYLNGRFSEPNAMIRYSWKQNQSNWDYTVNLLGHHATTEIPLQIGEQLTVKSIPYEEYPSWVIDKQWDAITFVQALEGFAGLEGIYAWSGLNNVRDRYLTGLDDSPPLDDFSQIEVGFRGQYVFKPALKAQLYFSPVDHQLHLLQAEAGIWNIDGKHKIHYENLGGAYINKWSLLDNDQVMQSLYVISDYVIHASENSIKIVRANATPALFTTTPPRNHEEWSQLSEQLDAYQSDFDPANLQAMLEQFGGRVSTIEGARLHDLRLLDDGFRFILDLQPGFGGQNLDILDLEKAVAGSYLVTYINDSFRIEEMTPSDLSLTVQLSESEEESGLAARPILVQVTNDGMEDAKLVNIYLEASHDGKSFEIAQRSVNVLSKELTQLSFTWLPASIGEWELRVRLENAVGVELTKTQLPVSVARGTKYETVVMTLMKGSKIAGILVLFLLSLLALLIANQAFALQERSN